MFSMSVAACLPSLEVDFLYLQIFYRILLSKDQSADIHICALMAASVPFPVQRQQFRQRLLPRMVSLFSLLFSQSMVPAPVP